MIYESLKFANTAIEGNTMATIKLDNGYQFDVIRKSKEKQFKVKGFEDEHNRKRYISSYFEGYIEHPIFNNKTDLMTFINQIANLEEE